MVQKLGWRRMWGEVAESGHEATINGLNQTLSHKSPVGKHRKFKRYFHPRVVPSKSDLSRAALRHARDTTPPCVPILLAD